MTDYERIEKAIAYIQKNFKDQPDLDAVARQVYLNPFHFQKLFKNWAGISPKKFLQFISVKYAKHLLKQNLSLRDGSFETGLLQSDAAGFAYMRLPCVALKSLLCHFLEYSCFLFLCNIIFIFAIFSPLFYYSKHIIGQMAFK